MTYGFTGKLLHIDLTAKTSRVERPSEALYRRFLGGKGLAGQYLAPHIRRSFDDPKTPILFFTGPLTGTIAPTSGRMTVMSVSPQTGTIGDANLGGRLGTELKKAGWDGIILTGRADDLCGVVVKDGEVGFRDAASLAGKTSGEVMDALAFKGAVASIGPAAENGSRMAAIMADRHHAAGRGGLGLSMAAKNCKYLCVRGSGKVPVHDLEALKTAREDIMRLTAASPVLMGGHGFSCFGTGSLYDLMDSRRMMPTDNFRASHFERAADLNAPAYKERYRPKKYGCRGCHILCKKVAPDGTSMPEFETMSHFTALIGNTDVGLVVAANTLCNELGLDTISAAATLAAFSEITGEKLTPERVLALLDDMGRGRGVGRELAQGSAAYARAMGKPELSMSVKGLELPAYDPRGAYGMSLAYALSTRGGCHLRAYPVSHEILRKPVATDRFTFSGKARIIKIAEDANAVVDSLAACKFVFFAASLEEYAHALTAATGLSYTGHDLQRLGERIYYFERMLNAARGFDAADDDLPPRFFTESGSSGDSIEIPPLSREDFLEARAKYYRIRGLDENGLPTRTKAEELELPWIG